MLGTVAVVLTISFMPAGAWGRLLCLTGLMVVVGVPGKGPHRSALAAIVGGSTIHIGRARLALHDCRGRRMDHSRSRMGGHKRRSGPGGYLDLAGLASCSRLHHPDRDDHGR